MPDEQTYEEGLVDESLEEIEEIIDKHGIADTLGLISDIMYEKAEHLRANWQDERGAKKYDSAGAAIDRFLNTRSIQAIP